MRRRLTAALTLGALSFTLAGCAPGSGTVVDKDYQLFGTCTWRDPKDGSCKASGPKWQLKISNQSASGWVEVSHHTYDIYKIGDPYPRRG